MQISNKFFVFSFYQFKSTFALSQFQFKNLSFYNKNQLIFWKRIRVAQRMLTLLLIILLMVQVISSKGVESYPNENIQSQKSIFQHNQIAVVQKIITPEIVSSDLYAQQQIAKNQEIQKYPFSKIIWIYEPNQTISEEKKIFINRTIEVLQINQQNTSGWRIKIVNNKDLIAIASKIDDLQFYNEALFFSTDNIKTMNRHYAKLAILYSKGGVFLDEATILYQDLGWMKLKSLLSNPRVLNKHLQSSPEPDVLLNFHTHHGYNKKYLKNDNFQSSDSPGYEIKFIAAKKNAQLLKDWMKIYKFYQGLECSQVYQDLKRNNVFIGDFPLDCRFKTEFSLYSTLQRKQNSIDSQYAFFNRISVHNYYKIWAIDCQNGSCFSDHSQNHSNIHPTQQWDLNFFKIPLEETLKKYNQTKLNHFSMLGHNSTKMQQYFKNLTAYYQNQRYKNKTLFQIFKLKHWPLQDCKSFPYVNSESVVGRYLKRQMKQYFKNASNVTRIFPKDQCQIFYKYCFERNLTINQTRIINKYEIVTEVNYRNVFQDFRGNYLPDPFIEILFYCLALRLVIHVLVDLFKKYQIDDSLRNFIRNTNQKQTNTNNTSNQNIQQLKDIRRHRQSQSSSSTDHVVYTLDNPQRSPAADSQLIRTLHWVIYLRFIPKFIYKVFGIQNRKIPYEIISILSIKHLYDLTTQFEHFQRKQGHAVVLFTLILILILRNWNVAFNKSKQICEIFHIESLVFRIFLTKMYLELVYSQPQSIHFATFYAAFFALTIIDMFQNHPFFLTTFENIYWKSYRNNAKQVNQIVALSFLATVWIVPNIQYHQVFGVYILEAAYRLLLIISWIFAVSIIASECIQYVGLKDNLAVRELLMIKTVGRVFKFTKTIVIIYATILVISLLYHRIQMDYWTKKEQFIDIFQILVVFLAVDHVYNSILRKIMFPIFLGLKITILLFGVIFLVQTDDQQIDNPNKIVFNPINNKLIKFLTILMSVSIFYGYYLVVISFSQTIVSKNQKIEEIEKTNKDQQKSGDYFQLKSKHCNAHDYSKYIAYAQHLK